MNNKIIKNNNGFTLVETMVAVIILTFTIAVFMNVVSNNYFYGKYARNEITANYLLQEVVDYIKNDRDTSVVLDSNGSWDNFVAKYVNNCPTSSGCIIDAYSGATTICPNEGCQPLYYYKNPTTNFYNYSSNDTPTSFVRKITAVLSNNNNQLDVIVTINWENGTLTKSKELKTSIMKW